MKKAKQQHHYKKGTIKIGNHILEPVDDKDVPPAVWEGIEKLHVDRVVEFLSNKKHSSDALKEEFDFSTVNRKLFLEVAEKHYGPQMRNKLKKEIWG